MKENQSSPFWRHEVGGDGSLTDLFGVGRTGSLPLPTKNLTNALVDRLLDAITGGELKPGDRLPTEKEMIVAYGVSKTVIREAVAALRSSGYVITRHGVGTFVADFSRHRVFQIDRDDVESIHEIVNVLQFRIAIETESAALAAEYATPEDLAAIDAALCRFEDDVASGSQAIDADFEFHRAIARATKNPLFVRFLDFLGSVAIPRSRLGEAAAMHTQQKRYLRKLQNEHRRIQQAIVERRPIRARKAIRDHLYISWDRYRKMPEPR